MARSKPNKLKSPHKQQLEEQHNKDKTENKPHITPQTSKTNKKATGIEDRSIKSSTTRETYVRNPENIPYYDGDTNVRRIYCRDRNQHQLDEDGETINSTDDEFVQPSDKDPQGNVLTDEELARKRMTDFHRAPSKEDSKPAAC
jgi:predicted DNA binding protein